MWSKKIQIKRKIGETRVVSLAELRRSIKTDIRTRITVQNKIFAIWLSNTQFDDNYHSVNDGIATVRDKLGIHTQVNRNLIN